MNEPMLKLEVRAAITAGNQAESGIWALLVIAANSYIISIKIQSLSSRYKKKFHFPKFFTNVIPI